VGVFPYILIDDKERRYVRTDHLTFREGFVITLVRICYHTKFWGIPI